MFGILKRKQNEEPLGPFEFEHSIEIDDVAVIEALDVMRRRRGGEELLAWKDGRQWRRLDASLVNDYIGTLTGVGATAKDFRTWHATVLAAASLAETDEPGDTKASRKRADNPCHAVSAAACSASFLLRPVQAANNSPFTDARAVKIFAWSGPTEVIS